MQKLVKEFLDTEGRRQYYEDKRGSLERAAGMIKSAPVQTAPGVVVSPTAAFDEHVIDPSYVTYMRACVVCVCERERVCVCVCLIWGLGQRDRQRVLTMHR